MLPVVSLELLHFLLDLLLVVVVSEFKIFDLKFKALEVVFEEGLVILPLMYIVLDESLDPLLEMLFVLIDFVFVFAGLFLDSSYLVHHLS